MVRKLNDKLLKYNSFLSSSSFIISLQYIFTFDHWFCTIFFFDSHFMRSVYTYIHILYGTLIYRSFFDIIVLSELELKRSSRNYQLFKSLLCRQNLNDALKNQNLSSLNAIRNTVREITLHPTSILSKSNIHFFKKNNLLFIPSLFRCSSILFFSFY